MMGNDQARPGARAGLYGALLALVLASTACSDTHLLSGTYRSVEPVTLAQIPGFTDVSVELVIGHYGPDVAGLLKYFGNTDFNIPPSADSFCRCSVLETGVWAGSRDTLTFAFPSPSPCPHPEDVAKVSVSLLLTDSDETLAGTLTPVQGDSVSVTFVRHKIENEMVPEDKECEAE